MNETEELGLSRRIEDILVARNLRGMKTVQPHLQPGYCLRAARILHGCRGNILIGTGFPVVKTFETDGPVGAIAMYEAFENSAPPRPSYAVARFPKRWRRSTAYTKSGSAITTNANTKPRRRWSDFSPRQSFRSSAPARRPTAAITICAAKASVKTRPASIPS